MHIRLKRKKLSRALAVVGLLATAIPAHAYVFKSMIPGLKAAASDASESLSATSLNFGNVAEGLSSSAQTVQLTNTGNTTITLGSITPTTGYSDSTTCSSSLAGGASCTVSVIFTPTVMAAQPGTLTIATSAGNQVVSLSGTGVEGVPQVSPGSLTYATTMIGSSSASQTVTLSNTGNWVFTLTASPSVSGPYSITANNCSGSVGAGASCSMAVSYVPTASGTQTGTLSIPTSSGTQTVSLSGTGQSSGHLVINGASDFNFGGVSYASGATTITNTGGASVTLTTAYSASSNEVSGTVTGTNAFSASPDGSFGTTSDLSMPPFAATGCTTGTVLAAGQSCTLTVYGQENNGININQAFYGVVSISIPGQTITVTAEEMFAD